MIYIVLGMHKSGTTLVSRILHHSGINMGEHEDSLSYDQGNMYERQSTFEMNVALLKHKSYIDVITEKTPNPIDPTPAQQKEMQAIIRHCDESYENWGFKDPRSCLTYATWEDYLPPHKIIAVYRNPSESWPRFRYNGWRKAHTNPYLAWRFIYSWSEHNAKVLRAVQNDAHESIVLSYRDLMAGDHEFERLQTFVGLPLHDQRKKHLYRSQMKRYPLLQLATWLVSWQTQYHPQKIMQQLENLSRHADQ